MHLNGVITTPQPLATMSGHNYNTAIAPAPAITTPTQPTSNSTRSSRTILRIPWSVFMLLAMAACTGLFWSGMFLEWWENSNANYSYYYSYYNSNRNTSSTTINDKVSFVSMWSVGNYRNSFSTFSKEWSDLVPCQTFLHQHRALAFMVLITCVSSTVLLVVYGLEMCCPRRFAGYGIRVSTVPLLFGFIALVMGCALPSCVSQPGYYNRSSDQMNLRISTGCFFWLISWPMLVTVTGFEWFLRLVMKCCRCGCCADCCGSQPEDDEAAESAHFVPSSNSSGVSQTQIPVAMVEEEREEVGSVYGTVVVVVEQQEEAKNVSPFGDE